MYRRHRKLTREGKSGGGEGKEYPVNSEKDTGGGGWGWRGGGEGRKEGADNPVLSVME